MSCHGGYGSDGRGWSSRCFLLFKLLLVVSWTVLQVQAQTVCQSDDDCGGYQYCRAGELPSDQKICTDCIRCEEQFNRAGVFITCPVEPLYDCGECLPGFNYSVVKKWFDQRDTPTVEQSAKCELISNLYLTEVEPAADTSDPDVTIAAGTYVGFAVLGLVVGATTGAAGTICYFRCKMGTGKSKKKNGTTNDDAETTTEMHELSPKTYIDVTDDEKDYRNYYETVDNKHNGTGKSNGENGYNGV